VPERSKTAFGHMKMALFDASNSLTSDFALQSRFDACLFQQPARYSSPSSPQVHRHQKSP
jgi:hypothetical protein